MLMARFLYSLILYAFLPLIRLRLWWRGRRQPAYREHVDERAGIYPVTSKQPLLWIHAVSVNETRACERLVRALQEHFPDHDVLLTSMTPAGREAGAQVFGDSVLQAYLPYDTPAAINRFLDHFRPRLGVLMETDIWPNLPTICAQRHIPVVLANARLSEKSAKGYRRLRSLFQPAFASLAGAAAQTEANAKRLKQLGADPVSVCGNPEYDFPVPVEMIKQGNEWRKAIGGRSILMAAGTREGEEMQVLAAWNSLADPDVLLVIVPQPPQNFDEIAALLERRQIPFIRRIHGLPRKSTRVWLGNRPEEMVAYYTLADIVFLGGSLVARGGRNLIEAAATGCPVLVGPHTFNFAQVTEDAIACGAARRVANPVQLAKAVNDLLADQAKCEEMGTTALLFAAGHRGATKRTLEFILQCSGLQEEP